MVRLVCLFILSFSLLSFVGCDRQQRSVPSGASQAEIDSFASYAKSEVNSIQYAMNTAMAKDNVYSEWALISTDVKNTDSAQNPVVFEAVKHYVMSRASDREMLLDAYIRSHYVHVDGQWKEIRKFRKTVRDATGQFPLGEEVEVPVQ